jgi:hypothetical protein
MKCRLFIVSGLFLLSTAFFADLASADESGSVSLVRATELSAAFRQAADKVVPATVKIISRLQTPEEHVHSSTLLLKSPLYYLETMSRQTSGAPNAKRVVLW